MKLSEVYKPSNMTDALNRLQVFKRPQPKEVTPEEKARAEAFRATRDAYRNEAEQMVQSYTADQKQQFLQDILGKFPDIAKYVDLEHVWMFSPAVKAERNKGLDPADDWKAHQPLPGSNYTGD